MVGKNEGEPDSAARHPLVGQPDAEGAVGAEAPGMQGADPPADPTGPPGEGGTGAEEQPAPQPSVLAQLGVDLTDLIASAHPGRPGGWERELRRLVEILGKRERHAAILVGPDGVGKRAVVLALADLMREGAVPNHLAGRHVVELPFHRVLGSMAQPGDFPRVVFMALREAASRDDVLLFLGQMTSFMGVLASGRALFDASYAIEMGLHQPGLFLLASGTPQLYATAVAAHPWLERAMTRIDVPEPSRQATLEMLRYAAGHLAEHHAAEIADEAIEAAVDLSSYYIKERVLPGKAFEILDEAASKAAAGRQKGDSMVLVGASHVAEALSDRIGIPLSKLHGVGDTGLLTLEERIKKRIKGQDHCVRKLADVVRVTKLGLDARPARADGVFLFVGEPGVGKSELARALAEELYGGTTRLFVFNMARYADEEGVARLIGLRLGDLDYPGELTSAVESHPHCVVVLEQIERTHVDVAMVLMQIFRDGYVVDGRGRKAHFSNATIIMTSNSENIVPGAGEDGRVGFGQLDVNEVDEYVGKVSQAIEEFFPPEFIEGVDEVLLFDRLSDSVVREIVQVHLNDVKTRLAERSIALEVTDEAVSAIAEMGHSRKYGARNLGRTVEGTVLKPLAKFLLANPGAREILVRSVEGGIEVGKRS